MNVIEETFLLSFQQQRQQQQLHRVTDNDGNNFIDTFIMAVIDKQIHSDCVYLLLRRQPDMLQRLLSRSMTNINDVGNDGDVGGGNDLDSDHHDDGNDDHGGNNGNDRDNDNDDGNDENNEDNELLIIDANSNTDSNANANANTEPNADKNSNENVDANNRKRKRKFEYTQLD